MKSPKTTIALAIVTLSMALSCFYPVSEDSVFLEEQHSVWQCLSVFSIYQDRVPPAPGNLTPYDMFALINDSLGGARYTEYVDDRPGGGVYPPPVLDLPVKITESTVYIRIPDFSDTSLIFWNRHLSLLENYPNIIIDLRRNGGGLLNACQEMVSDFIEYETDFIRLRHRDYNDREFAGMTVTNYMHSTKRNPWLLNKNISILIDGGSASASEIMAAALKDFAGANLVGTRTYGKGIGQVIYSRPERKTLSITSMEISGLTPRTGYYHKIGIEPDPIIEDYMNEAEEKLPKDPYLYYAVKLLEPEFTLEGQEPSKQSLQRMRQVAETTQQELAKQKESEHRVTGAFVVIEGDPLKSLSQQIYGNEGM
jgi:hypothetical protein